ncbi:MAG TPA: phytanoyl-CoA dioxygenase family protein [Burkholderiales bacterium]|nr:phytanoyl-CoA dioxygenase family protein [Burkholderiales bacterium]
MLLERVFAPAELERYAQDGYVVARGLVDPAAWRRMREAAVEALENAVPPLELEADVRYPGAPASHDAPGGRTVRRLLGAYSRHPEFAQWGLSRELGNRLAQLLGRDVELSQAHHNCVMTKSPSFSSSTGWHRDVRYWSFERPELVSVWLALGAERRDNGCLLVLPGSHAMTFSQAQLDEAQFLRTDAPENQALLARQVAVELDPGDVLFFDARLFHAAGSNTTGDIKFSVVFTYHAADNRPLPGSRSAALPDVPLPAPERSRVE